MANRRKTEDKKKSCLVGFAVTQEVWEAYHARAEELGITLSELCRRTMDRELAVREPSRNPVDRDAFVRALQGMGKSSSL